MGHGPAVKLTKDEPGRVFAYAEGEDGRRLAEDDPVGRPGDSLIIKFTTHETAGGEGKE